MDNITGGDPGEWAQLRLKGTDVKYITSWNIFLMSSNLFLLHSVWTYLPPADHVTSNRNTSGQQQSEREPHLCIFKPGAITISALQVELNCWPVLLASWEWKQHKTQTYRLGFYLLHNLILGEAGGSAEICFLAKRLNHHQSKLRMHSAHIPVF